MPESRRSATNVRRLALGCIALLLVLFGGLSRGGTESGRTIAVQVLRQAIGLRVQSAQLRILASNPAGDDEPNSTSAGVSSMDPGWLHEYVVALRAPLQLRDSRQTANDGLSESRATLELARARAPPCAVL